MSAARVIAQGNPQQTIGLPAADFRMPVLYHARVQVGASGAPTLVAGRDVTGGPASIPTGVAGSTQGLAITRSTNGIYDVTFDANRGIMLGTWCFAYLPNATGTDHFNAVIDKTTTFTNSNPTLGKLRFATNAEGTATAADPTSGSEMHFSFWADLG